jgi:hypothetical protein
MKFNTLTLISFALIISSCSFFESSSSKEITSMNKELTNLNKKYKDKKIDLSANLFNKVFKNKKDGDLSMLIYYDANCTICFTKLKKWKDNLDYFKKTDKNLNIKFILYSDDSLMTDINLEKTNFPKSLIVYDTDNSYLKKYEHVLEYPYNTMLLNKNNEIIFIGSPQVSSNLRKHYTKLIKQ